MPGAQNKSLKGENKNHQMDIFVFTEFLVNLANNKGSFYDKLYTEI